MATGPRCEDVIRHLSNFCTKDFLGLNEKVSASDLLCIVRPCLSLDIVVRASSWVTQVETNYTRLRQFHVKTSLFSIVPFVLCLGLLVTLLVTGAIENDLQACCGVGTPGCTFFFLNLEFQSHVVGAFSKYPSERRVFGHLLRGGNICAASAVSTSSSSPSSLLPQRCGALPAEHAVALAAWAENHSAVSSSTTLLPHAFE